MCPFSYLSPVILLLKEFLREFLKMTLLQNNHTRQLGGLINSMNIVYNLLQQIKNPEKNKPSSEVDIKKASQARLGLCSLTILFL